MKEERNGGKRTRDVSHLEECLYVVTGSVRQTTTFPLKKKNLFISVSQNKLGLIRIVCVCNSDCICVIDVKYSFCYQECPLNVICLSPQCL